MNWELIYYIGQTLGLFVIIATLISLFFQIRQTNHLSKLGTSREIWSDGYQMFQNLFGSAETGQLMHKALFTDERLSEDEKTRFGVLLGSFISMHENGHMMARSGQMCDGLWPRMKTVLQIFAGKPRFISFWEKSRSLYDPNPSFQTEIDALIENCRMNCAS